MLWECERDCDAGGRKTYDSPAEARRYAAAFDREDRDELGRRAPVLGMFPLRLWHKIPPEIERFVAEDREHGGTVGLVFVLEALAAGEITGGFIDAALQVVGVVAHRPPAAPVGTLGVRSA
jgi:hypothetical protein